MVDRYQLSRDDLLDVIEMRNDLQEHISKVLRDNSLNLSLSALIAATANCIIANCDYEKEAFFYRDAFVNIFNKTVEAAMKSD